MLLSYQWILGWYGIVLEFIWQICNLILITYLVLAIYLLSTYIWISIYILVNLKFNYFCKDFTFLQCFLELKSEETRPGFIQILCLFSNNVFPLIFLYPQTSKIASPNTHYVSSTAISILQKCFICLTAGDLILPFYIYYRVTWNKISTKIKPFFSKLLLMLYI